MMLRVLIAIIAVLPASCDKNTSQELSLGPIEELIFGVGFAECGGDCAKIYQLKGELLFADEDINYITSVEQEFTFQAEPLHPDKFRTAEVLLKTFPEELWIEQQQIIGQPNAHDQGGIILAVTRAGITKRWYIDLVEERQPKYLIPYTREIKAVINKLIEE